MVAVLQSDVLDRQDHRPHLRLVGGDQASGSQIQEFLSPTGTASLSGLQEMQRGNTVTVPLRFVDPLSTYEVSPPSSLFTVIPGSLRADQVGRASRLKPVLAACLVAVISVLALSLVWSWVAGAGSQSSHSQRGVSELVRPGDSYRSLVLRAGVGTGKVDKVTAELRAQMAGSPLVPNETVTVP